MPDAPKHRWFRFSLRTMFLVITAIACWLGWNLHVVQTRLAARRLIVENGGVVFVIRGMKISPIDADGGPGVAPFAYDIGLGEQWMISIPLVRRLLGDDFVALIHMPRDGATPMTSEDVKRIFPEATHVWPYWRSELSKMGISIEEDDP